MYLTYKIIHGRKYNLDLLFDTGTLQSQDLNKIPKDVLTRTLNTEYKPGYSNEYLIQTMIVLNGHLKNALASLGNPATHYTTFKIPKHSGGFREINAPDELLSDYIKETKRILELDLQVLTHDSAFAYVKTRSAFNALQRHQRNKSRWFLKLDIKKFFDNCTPEFIKEQLKQIHPFSYVYIKAPNLFNETIDNLTKLCCLNNELPQGTQISPLLTNLIMIPIDYKITKYLNEFDRRQRFVYTRYADDILISAKNNWDWTRTLLDIQEILKDTPLEIKQEKTRYGSSSGRNWNLGLMYTRDNNITIGAKRKRYIKAGMHNFELNPDGFDLESLQHLLGEVSYIQSIEPEYNKDKINKIKKEIIIRIKRLNN